MKSKRAGSDITFGLSCLGGERSKPQRATNQALFNQRLLELELLTDGVPFDCLRCGGSARPGAAAGSHTPSGLTRRVAGRLRPQPGTNQEHLDQRLLELELAVDDVRFDRLGCGGSARPRSCRKVVTFDSFAFAVWSKP